MSRVDPLSQTIVINESCRIKFCKEDVYDVFGIPCTGWSVHQNGIPSKEVISKMMSCYLGGDGKDHRSVKAAQGVIEHENGSEMTVEQQNSFKASFVIYMMLTLLSPGAKYDCRIVEALIDPFLVSKFDWATYIFDVIKDSARFIQNRQQQESPDEPIYLNGCIAFLNVSVSIKRNFFLSFMVLLDIFHCLLTLVHWSCTDYTFKFNLIPLANFSSI